MTKKYLITGGSGFIGASITKALLENKKKVTVIDNNQRGSLQKLNLKDKNLKFIKGDIRNKKILDKACKNIDVIIHCAYVNGTKTFYEKPDLVLEIAVEGMVNLIKACKRKNIKEFYLISSSEVYYHPKKIPTPENIPLIIPDIMNPRFSYSGGKIISELMTIHNLKKYVNKRVIVRPHNVFGPDMGWEHLIPEIIKKIFFQSNGFKKKTIKLKIQGNGTETRAFTYIDDFVNGFLLLLKKAKDSHIYHIGNNKEVTIKYILNNISSSLGIKIKLIKSKLLKGSTPRRCPDISKIKKLGFKIKTDLKKNIFITSNWYKKKLLKNF